VDPDLCVVSSAEPDLLSVGKADHVHLLLCIGLRLADLARLDDDVVVLRLVDRKDRVHAAAYLEVVLELLPAKLAVESLPGIGGHVRVNFFVLIATQPLLKALQVHPFHGARARARRYQGVLFRIGVFGEADPTDLFVGASVSLEATLFLIDVEGFNNIFIATNILDSSIWAKAEAALVTVFSDAVVFDV